MRRVRQTPECKIKRNFWTGRTTVIDKVSGRRAIARPGDVAHLDAMLAAVDHLRIERRTDDLMTRALLTQRFAMTVLAPDTFAAKMFRDAEPYRMAQTIFWTVSGQLDDIAGEVPERPRLAETTPGTTPIVDTTLFEVSGFRICWSGQRKEYFAYVIGQEAQFPIKKNDYDRLVTLEAACRDLGRKLPKVMTEAMKSRARELFMLAVLNRQDAKEILELDANEVAGMILSAIITE